MLAKMSRLCAIPHTELLESKGSAYQLLHEAPLGFRASCCGAVCATVDALLGH